MTPLRTHYDNLQIARTASDSVIRAAYKVLSQKFHPDKNPDNLSQAEARMKIINEAFRVLSDPLRKAEHDAWIAYNENQLRLEEQTAAPQRSAVAAGSATRQSFMSGRAEPAGGRLGVMLSKLTGLLCWVVCLTLMSFAVLLYLGDLQQDFTVRTDFVLGFGVLTLLGCAAALTESRFFAPWVAMLLMGYNLGVMAYLLNVAPDAGLTEAGLMYIVPLLVLALLVWLIRRGQRRSQRRQLSTYSDEVQSYADSHGGFAGYEVLPRLMAMLGWLAVALPLLVITSLCLHFIPPLHHLAAQAVTMLATEQGREMAQENLYNGVTMTVDKTQLSSSAPHARSHRTAPTFAGTSLTAGEKSTVVAACHAIQNERNYQSCLRTQVALATSAGPLPSQQGLTAGESATVAAACSTLQHNGDIAGYQSCMHNQMALLAADGMLPDMNQLTAAEQTALAAACSSYQKNGKILGYRSCLRDHLSSR